MGEKEQKVLYLCDGEVPECPKTHCYKTTDEPACRHTSDIRHAVNFEEGGETGAKNNYWERGQIQVEMTADQMAKE